jgi:hypothetical protein
MVLFGFTRAWKLRGCSAHADGSVFRSACRAFGVSGGELAIAFVRPRLEDRAQKKKRDRTIGAPSLGAEGP